MEQRDVSLAVDKPFYLYDVEARAGLGTSWLTVRVVAQKGFDAILAAKPLAAGFFGVDESMVSLRTGNPALMVDALVGLIEPNDGHSV